MKTFFQIVETVHNSFAVASLLHALEWLLRCVILSAVCCGIVTAGDRPASYFKREEGQQRQLYAQKPVADLGQPLTFEAKPKYRGDRPSSYFKRDEPAQAAEFELPDFEPIEDETPDERAQIDIEDDPAAPKLPDDEPKIQTARYQPTFASVLRHAVHVLNELPEALGDEQPDDFQPVVADFYSPPWCKFCPEVLARLNGDPRLTFNLKKEEFPVARPDGEPWDYPLIVDPESNIYVRHDYLKSPDTVLERLNDGRARRGLTLSAQRPDIVVGDVACELVEPLLSSDEGNWKFKNKAETFTHKAFTVSIPAGLVIRGSSDKRGSRIDFTGEKPTIKVNGFWHMKRNVNSVVASKTAVTLNLNWWQTISWEVR